MCDKNYMYEALPQDVSCEDFCHITLLSSLAKENVIEMISSLSIKPESDIVDKCPIATPSINHHELSILIENHSMGFGQHLAVKICIVRRRLFILE